MGVSANSVGAVTPYAYRSGHTSERVNPSLSCYGQHCERRWQR